MNRLKLLAMATLMAVTFTACDEGTPPPVEPPPPPDPVGTISGTVTIDGAGAAGITATLSSGTTTTTNTSGAFSFAGVVAGSYTVSISGFADDVTFPSASQAATIASDGQTVTLNFAGQYIRSSSVVGAVVASDPMMSGSSDGQPETLAGVTVTLSGQYVMGEMGEMSVTQETDMETGGYAFTGLRAGIYTVEISGYPEDVKFEELSMTIEVGVGDVGNANFEGAYIRTAAIEGRVIIEGEGLPGVTVTLVGGPADESYTKMTGADGEYAFTELRPGDYQVDISGYDPRDYEFAATSQEVSVALDETETVSFTGELLRTAGISGRVSVEGMGLADIAVTLSGAADASTTTDASGQFAFAGLAAGDYTVSIAVESDAYVFDAMSADVTVADEESAIVNFEGAHATTASVSGMLFIDELDKNDAHDDGEHPLAQAGVPVALVGPGVNDQRLSATGPDGTFMFSELRAGPYQLVVPIDAGVAAALAENDLAYGGPATGYAFALGVGEAKSQGVPFDITHTTVNFTVSLRSGEETGDALPGAMVTLYSDADGETKAGGGETGEDGSVAIKVARARTSGNMVHAGVSADGYSVADGMTAVSWDPQYNMTAGANENDIVNLNVDVTVSGATITTAYGGGDALVGWAISVMSGEDAVEGAPEVLDDDGNAAFMTTVESVPASFSFALADDQDDEMDGGESYEADAVEYEHTGLSLAGTMNAGSLVANYTTQTLKVYVHQELDQVMGYTGNVLGGDKRDGSDDDRMVDVDIRYIDDSGRSRSFTKAMWDAAKNTSDSTGVWTFAHLPADKDVIVEADEKAGQNIMLLDPDELAAYTGMEANGITGGAFGEMGGFNHTVELCPLKATAPQDHGECATFAYVTTHTVSGLVWKKGVVKSGEDFEVNDPTRVPGQTVSLSPVEGKNLAGEEKSYTTAKDDNDKTTIDERLAFNFGEVAAGVYELSVPDGWRAMMGPKDAVDNVGDALNPLAGEVALDITPATATLYGRVIGTDKFPLDSVTVTVNGRSAMTDTHGRYIIDGIAPETRKIGSTTHTNSIFVEASREGFTVATLDPISFEGMANEVTEKDINLAGVQSRATVSGKVTASNGGAPIAGVEIMVDDEAPVNAATTGSNKGKLVTDADGNFTAVFPAKSVGDIANVSASKAGWTFVPAQFPVAAHPGAVSTATFSGFTNATITGSVAAPGGGPLEGAVVTATPATGTKTVVDTTGVTGYFALSVAGVGGVYTLTVSKGDAYVFDIPAVYRGAFGVAPGQVVNVGVIQAKTAMARGVSASRGLTPDDPGTADTDESDPPTYTGTVTVKWTGSADDVPEGYNDAEYTIQTKVGTADWGDQSGATIVADSSLARIDSGTGVVDGEFMVRVVATATHTDGSTASLVLDSDPYTVGAVDPMASGVTASRVATADTTVVDSLKVSWNATTNGTSAFRIVVQVAPASLGGTAPVWLIVDSGSGSTLTSASRSWDLEFAHDFTVATWDVAAPNGQQDVTVTRADLDKALMIRVESVQGTATADNPWKASTAASVPAVGG